MTWWTHFHSPETESSPRHICVGAWVTEVDVTRETTSPFLGLLERWVFRTTSLRLSWSVGSVRQNGSLI